MALLDNHPQMENRLGLDSDHVIVDKKDWEEVKAFLNTDKINELYNHYKNTPLGRKGLGGIEEVKL